jgi:hypothetical protein
VIGRIRKSRIASTTVASDVSGRRSFPRFTKALPLLPLADIGAETVRQRERWSSGWQLDLPSLECGADGVA